MSLEITKAFEVLKTHFEYKNGKFDINHHTHISVFEDEQIISLFCKAGINEPWINKNYDAEIDFMLNIYEKCANMGKIFNPYINEKSKCYIFTTDFPLTLEGVRQLLSVLN